MRPRLSAGLLAGIALMIAAGSTSAADTVEMSIVIKNHMFVPAELVVPAGKTVVLTVDNQDATPEEFESHKAHVEKIIPGRSKGKVRIRPLAVGSYPFVGEFNEATAKGVIVAQ